MVPASSKERFWFCIIRLSSDGARGMKINLEKISAAIGTVITSKRNKKSAEELKNKILLKIREEKQNETISRAALVMALEELTKGMNKDDLDDAIDRFLEELVAELFEDLEIENLELIFPSDSSTETVKTTSDDNPMYR